MNQVGKIAAESGRARKDESKPSLGSVPASSDPAEQLPWSPRYWLPPSLWHISHGEPPEGHWSWVHFTRILPSRSQPSLVLTRFFFRRTEWKIGVSCCTFSSRHTFRVPQEVQPWTWAPQGSRNVPSCIGGKTAKQQKKQNKKNPPCIISGHILEKNNTCTFPTAAEDSQARQLSREPSGKDKGKRPRTQGVCRQSGRLLKIARNSHAAGLQRQKAGRFRKEQPQKEAG